MVITDGFLEKTKGFPISLVSLRGTSPELIIGPRKAGRCLTFRNSFTEALGRCEELGPVFSVWVLFKETFKNKSCNKNTRIEMEVSW